MEIIYGITIKTETVRKEVWQLQARVTAVFSDPISEDLSQNHQMT